jgi:hypothetical protein
MHTMPYISSQGMVYGSRISRSAIEYCRGAH